VSIKKTPPFNFFNNFTNFNDRYFKLSAYKVEGFGKMWVKFHKDSVNRFEVIEPEYESLIFKYIFNVKNVLLSSKYKETKNIYYVTFENK